MNDPLENFFCCQRQWGGTSENPNIKECCKNTQALCVINSVCGTVTKGNTKGNKQSLDVKTETRPLPKRQGKQKKPPVKNLPTILKGKENCTEYVVKPSDFNETRTEAASDTESSDLENITSPEIISPVTSEISDDEIPVTSEGVNLST